MYRSDLHAAYEVLSEVHEGEGKPAQAIKDAERACEVMEGLATGPGTILTYRLQLVTTLFRIGHLQDASGRSTDALRTYDRAIAYLERFDPGDPSTTYNRACARSLKAATLRQLGGEAASQAGPLEDAAVADLRRSLALGFRNFRLMATDTDLNPLRSRPDFRLLLMDATFPANPFRR
jgi:eukaryotic-like serine/threonine-protein kinase